MTLKWMLHRITHRKTTYILLGILLICYLVTGGLSRSYSENSDLMVLNAAFATSFDTIEAWRAWHTSWQFTWLISAISMTGLLPFLVNIIPYKDAPEATVPVVMGQSRSSLFFAQLICYDLAAVILWLAYLVVGYRCLVYLGNAALGLLLCRITLHPDVILPIGALFLIAEALPTLSKICMVLPSGSISPLLFGGAPAFSMVHGLVESAILLLLCFLPIGKEVTS